MAYTDLATYSTDTSALLAEVPPEFQIKDDNDKVIGIQWAAKIGTANLGNKSVAFVRCNDAQLAMAKGLKNLKILAEVPAGGDLLAAMTPANLKLYKGVYNPQPYTITLEDGTTHTITPPLALGAFA